MAQTVAQPKPKPRTRRTKPHAAVPPELAHDIQQLLQELQNLELLEEDGEPLESEWHVVQIHLLDDLVRQHLGPTPNYFCGGNMFVYYSTEQAQALNSGRPAYKGSDFFVVRNVDGSKSRRYWAAWEEGGRYPDLVIELISPRTAKKDKEENLRLYAEVLRVQEYFWYDQDVVELRGYRLVAGRYEGIEPNERGWLWSEVLGAYLGVWEGVYNGRRYRWLRLYGADGSLVPTPRELLEQERVRVEQERQRAEQERQRAEQERQRAEQAEAELERLRALLRERGIEV
ncbi:MAG: Uma2 family endonuclease [Armatimonadota bacterium]